MWMGFFFGRVKMKQCLWSTENSWNCCWTDLLRFHQNYCWHLSAEFLTLRFSKLGFITCFVWCLFGVWLLFSFCKPSVCSEMGDAAKWSQLTEWARYNLMINMTLYNLLLSSLERKSFLSVTLNGSFSFLEIFLDLCHLPTQQQLFRQVFTSPHFIRLSLRCKYYALLLSEKQGWMRGKV